MAVVFKTSLWFFFFFFFNDTATTEIYTLSLHDALPISAHGRVGRYGRRAAARRHDARRRVPRGRGDRKSTRLNSSHSQISYAVFCLKKKKSQIGTIDPSSSALSPALPVLTVLSSIARTS